MSPDQVREILKGASKTVKQQPTNASEEKVVELEEEDKEDKDGWQTTGAKNNRPQKTRMVI